MIERKLPRVQGLALERNLHAVLSGHGIALLSDERMSVQLRLQPDLIALPRHEPHLDEGAFVECLPHGVVADRVFPSRIT